MTVPFNTQQAIERLRGELAAHGSLFIAFDFDNTIFDYHNSGRDCHDVIDLLRRCSGSSRNHTMILLTSNEDEEKLAFMRYYCRHFGIRIDYVNENPIVCRGCRKPYYNILLDDRAGLQEACEVLTEVLNEESPITDETKTTEQ